MRYQSRRERDRTIDNLARAERELRKQGKEGTDEHKRVKQWLSDARYGRPPTESSSFRLFSWSVTVTISTACPASASCSIAL